MTGAHTRVYKNAVFDTNRKSLLWSETGRKGRKIRASKVKLRLWRPLFYVVRSVFYPQTDGAGSHPDKPEIGKIKRYAKIKKYLHRHIKRFHRLQDF